MSRDIDLTLIDVDPANARQYFDTASIAELAQSIAASGLAVPILIRPVGDRFMIVHGERRYRAIASLLWAKIPAEVRELNGDAASWLALVENVQRADLSPIEEAQAYQIKLSNGITQSELGQKLGKSQSYIATKLRLLKLPEFVQAAIRLRLISEGHAKQLLRLNCPEVQCFFASIIAHDKLSVAQVHDRINKLIADASEQLAHYAESLGFVQALQSAPSESPLVKRYGRKTDNAWIAQTDLVKNDWLHLMKHYFTISKVTSIIRGEELI